MDCQITETETQVCVTCPEIIAVPAQPEQIITEQLVGWNASAVSKTRLAGDVFTEYTVPLSVVGVIIGLENERLSDSPVDITHGIYAFQDSGRVLWAVVEGGEQRTTPAARTENTKFRIERRNGVVRYFVDSKQVYVSLAPSFGEVVVVGLLFTSGDTVN